MSGSGAASIIGAVSTLISTGISAASAMKSTKVSKPQSITPPTVTPVSKMPEMDDAAVRAAKRREILQRTHASGRSSTILTDRETLG